MSCRHLEEAETLGLIGLLESVAGIVAVEDSNRLADGGQLLLPEPFAGPPLGRLGSVGRLHLPDELRVRRHLGAQLRGLLLRLRLGQPPGAVLLHQRHQSSLGRAQHPLLGPLQGGVGRPGTGLRCARLCKVLRKGLAHLPKHAHDVRRSRRVLHLEGCLAVQLPPFPVGGAAPGGALEQLHVGLAEVQPPKFDDLLEASLHVDQLSRLFLR
mmetsp:Transcript_62697/g.178024  ORF Transcript_62697/g.178024 Transcript_62697/m.178024 type:complete len:212 (+) Transcript_62697:1158-1793(+)